VQLSKSEGEVLLHLEDTMHKRVVGQDLLLEQWLQHLEGREQACV
jgi:ATP-dependent Clp protease ATP-binding subunit ClpA